MKTHSCIVDWTAREAGGRDVPFSGTWYSTAARFPEDPTWWEAGWSIVLEFDVPPTVQGNPSSGTARFLVDEAPHHWLREGQVFRMYEGRRMTATVTITE